MPELCAVLGAGMLSMVRGAGWAGLGGEGPQGAPTSLPAPMGQLLNGVMWRGGVWSEGLGGAGSPEIALLGSPQSLRAVV